MWQLTSVWGALIPEVKCLLACKESYQIPDQRGPVGRYSPKVTEELVEVLGAVGGVVAAVKHQECGYRLLHKPLGVHCRPGGFRRPVRRPSVRPPLALHAPHLVNQRRIAALLPELAHTLSLYVNHTHHNIKDHVHHTTYRTLIDTIPRRVNSRGGTSHSDPITTTVRALRPNVLLRSPPVWVGPTGGHDIQRLMVAPAVWAHTLSSTLSLSLSLSL